MHLQHRLTDTCLKLKMANINITYQLRLQKKYILYPNKLNCTVVQFISIMYFLYWV